MRLPIETVSLDAIPEVHRELYVADEKKGFRLDVSDIPDTTSLKNALQAERKQRAEAEKRRKEIEVRFDGIDPDVHRQLQDDVQKTEDAKLSDAERLAKQTEQMQHSWQKKLDQMQLESKAAIDQAQKQAKAYQGKVLENSIRAACTQAGLHPSAHDDALARARGLFTLSEDGEPVILEDGFPKIGPDGKKPFSHTDWLESIRSSTGHWYPLGASGGGSTQTQSGGASVKNMTRQAFSSLTPTQKKAFVSKGGRLV